MGGRAGSHQVALTSGPGRPRLGTHEHPTSLWGTLTKVALLVLSNLLPKKVLAKFLQH